MLQSLLGRVTGSKKSNKLKNQSLTLEENTAGTLHDGITPKSQNNESNPHLKGNDLDTGYDVTSQKISQNDNALLRSNDVDFLFKYDPKRKSHDISRDKDNSHIENSLYVENNLNNIETEDPHNNKKYLLSTFSGDFDVGYETDSTASTINIEKASHLKHSTFSKLANENVKQKPTHVVHPVLSKQNYNTPILMRSVSQIITPQVSQYKHNNYVHTNELQTIKSIMQNHESELNKLRHENRHLKKILKDLEIKKNDLFENLEIEFKKASDDNTKFMENQSKFIQQIKDKSGNNNKMNIVMEEFEKTMYSIMVKQQKDNIQVQRSEIELLSERDQVLNHLLIINTSFNDLFTKYEHYKSLIYKLKQKEQLFKENVSNYDMIIEKYEYMYTNLKQSATENLNSINEAWKDIINNQNSEVIKLNATIKKHDITISSLQESIAQKTHDNKELTAICDDLLNKV